MFWYSNLSYSSSRIKLNSLHFGFILKKLFMIHTRIHLLFSFSQIQNCIKKEIGLNWNKQVSYSKFAYRMLTLSSFMFCNIRILILYFVFFVLLQKMQKWYIFHSIIMIKLLLTYYKSSHISLKNIQIFPVINLSIKKMVFTMHVWTKTLIHMS